VRLSYPCYWQYIWGYTISIKIIDNKSEFTKLLSEIKKAGKSYTQVGYQGDEKENKKDKDGNIEKSKATIVEVAAYNEFGTKNIPERSFMRKAFDRVEHQIDKLTNNLYIEVCTGKKTTKKALAIVGEFLKSEIQKQIDMTIEPKNAESTIRRKKSSHPLIDTGLMRESVTHTEKIKG
jgi:hypothetical protein